MESKDFFVESLGECTISSPLKLSETDGDGIYNYIELEDRILYDASLQNFLKCKENATLPLSFEKAGPWKNIFFDPENTKVGIVTCGGLCPGLNDVIRGLVLQLRHRYKVKDIKGFRYGYQGFISKYNIAPIDLTIERVEQIHLFGGSILGSSRGHQDINEIVNTLVNLNINILFCIGGDGTLRGANKIAEEVKRRSLNISIAGIPKTIDNDINYIERSFGFETAFSIANEVIGGANNEATGAYNGIALVKLMGRDAGFIAANAALSIQEVSFVLIPEMHFELEGENGFLNTLKQHLRENKHAVIVVAEGAGQHLFDDNEINIDTSGNKIHKDIGIFLKEKIKSYLKKEEVQHSIKYIDPSYIIRSAPANPNDSKFCSQLAQYAVHAAMAGKTNFVVGNWNSDFTILPIETAVSKRKEIDIEGELWWNVLETTGQPMRMY